MKKLKVLLVICILFSVSVSTVSFANDYKTANAFVRVTTNMLGYNFIAKKIAQGVVKRSLKKNISGDFKVKFDSFSGVDLKKGKFKGLVIHGENLSVKDELYISKLDMGTTSDFNYVDYRKNPMVFKTDLPFIYNIEVSESDLNKTLALGEAFDTISAMIPFVRITKPVFTIENDKIRMKSSLKMPLGKTIKFSMSTGLKVENGKIVLSDMKSSGSEDFANTLINLVNKQNMLENINLDVFDNADTVVKIENVKINDKKLLISGKLVINKTK